MAQYFSPRVATNGLTMYLDASNRKSYPGSGTAWYDLSGNSNVGTLTNSPTFTMTRLGEINFDGTDDYVSVANNSSILMSSTTEQYTAEVVFRSQSSSSKGACALFDQYRHYFYYSYSNNTSYFQYITSAYNGSNYPTSTLTLSGLNPKGSWNHVVFTYTKIGSNATLTGYVNGNYSGAVTGLALGTYPNLSVAMIGNSYHAGLNYYAFDGSIAVVKTYSRALTDSEVSQNFSAVSGRFGL